MEAKLSKQEMAMTTTSISAGNNFDYITTLTGQIIDCMCFLLGTWGQLSFVKFRAIREGHFTSVYDRLFETFFRDQLLY